MIDFNNPVLVTMEVASPVADFHMTGNVGWQDKISLSFLPPYPNTLDNITGEVISLLEDIVTVPYDNLGGMESLQSEVDRVHKLAIETLEKEGMLSLQDGFVFNNVVYENNIAIYNLHVSLRQRVDSEDTKTVLDKL